MLLLPRVHARIKEEAIYSTHLSEFTLHYSGKDDTDNGGGCRRAVAERL